jgi:gamma-glutamyltranspeptidase
VNTGGVATPHPDATAAGYAQLEAGGSAIDAALAAAAVLAVALPNQCSIGGDIIAAFNDADGVKILNGSGRAGSKADAAEPLPTYGAKTVTVPGVIDAWSVLHARGGNRPWGAVLEPAITLAADGVAIAPGLARAMEAERLRIFADPGLTDLLTKHNGALLTAGEPLVQPALARILIDIAAEGRDVFYEGAHAATISDHLTRSDGFLTADDFAAHESTIEAPITVEWGGYTWYTSAPPTQGVAFLQILEAFAQLGTDNYVSDAAAELYAALMFAVNSERDAILGADATVSAFLGERCIDRLIEQARNTGFARGRAAKPTGDTVAVVAMDSMGGAVTLIQSVFHAFGSGILEPATGIVLQNRGSSFTTSTGPNQLRPGYRPLHTLMPVLVGHGTQIFGAHGTMGGKAQPQIHAQLALALAGGLTAQQAVDAPRCVVGPLTADSDPRTLLVEPGVDERIVSGAKSHGFPVETRPPSDDLGHAQIVRRRSDATFDVGTDVRAI